MPKRIISFLITLSLMLTATGAAMAVETSSAFEPVTFDDSIAFSATLQSNGSVLSTWSKYNHAEEFTYYKLVRSESNNSPVYPEDGYIYYGGDLNELSYTDSDLIPGTYYYRICQIASPKRYCSSTVSTIVVGETTPTEPTQPADPIQPVETTEPVATTVSTEATTPPAPVETAEPELYTAPTPTLIAATRFSDLPADHWAYQCVESLAEAGIVDSQTKTQFFPNNPINRAEFLKLVMLAYYPELSTQANAFCFSDVRQGDWFAPYVCAAKGENIVSGYSNNTFGPGRSITRAEGAALLVKALHIPLSTDLSGYFPDIFQQWQLDYVQTAYVNGLVNGYTNGQFGPDNSLARSEAAQLICNALESYPEPLDAPVDYDQYVPSEDEQPAQPEIPTTPPSSDTTAPTTPVTISGSTHNHAPLIINHTTANLNNVPQSAIDTAKSAFRIAYGHTSHGSQLTSGMEVLKGQNSLYDYNSTGSSGALYYDDNVIWGDLGGDWEAQTRDLLNSNSNNINMVMWSWCGQMSDMSEAQVNSYLTAMNALEEDYPNVIFVYMTGHLDGSGEGGTLHRNNQMVRAFAQQYNKVLYDFADIESYDPSGAYFLNRAADAANNYDSGNWSTQWCAANSGSPLCQSVSCAHSESLNCNLKGRAFWYMMARLGGWGG